CRYCCSGLVSYRALESSAILGAKGTCKSQQEKQRSGKGERTNRAHHDKASRGRVKGGHLTKSKINRFSTPRIIAISAKFCQHRQSGLGLEAFPPVCETSAECIPRSGNPAARPGHWHKTPRGTQALNLSRNIWGFRRRRFLWS